MRHSPLKLLLIFVIPGAATAQEPGLMADARVRAALEHAAALEPWTIEQQISICEIPAPPFKEVARAEEFRARLSALGLANARIDAEGNVIATRAGAAGEPVVVVSGHLDTVFLEGTDVTVTREGALLRGPGIGDDCRGLAVLLAVARTVQERQLPTRGTIVFVGTVGEEGAGNLRGVRHLFAREMPGQIDYFISVDGDGLSLTKDAVASHRYTFSYEGPGGHSYGAFGMPNPMHALGRAIGRIADVEVPADPRVTFSVGVVRGGTSVNSIAAQAQMDIDMRSQDQRALEVLDATVQRIVREALVEENARWNHEVKLRLVVDTIGLRPGGGQPESAAIVQVGVAAARALGGTPDIHASSTDANVPISLGIPAVTIGGGGTGTGAHTLDEAYDTTDSHVGTQWVLLYVIELAGLAPR